LPIANRLLGINHESMVIVVMNHPSIITPKSMISADAANHHSRSLVHQFKPEKYNHRKKYNCHAVAFFLDYLFC
jgi:hypothetical protein